MLVIMLFLYLSLCYYQQNYTVILNLDYKIWVAQTLTVEPSFNEVEQLDSSLQSPPWW